MGDPRHEHRLQLFQRLFASTFTAQSLERALTSENQEIVDILNELAILDVDIQRVAPERPLSEINKVDLAIMRLVVFESKHSETPKLVLLNEAIELAKQFGSEKSSKFVNGALAHLLLEEKNQ
ncbi:hypothetical protein KBC79_05815 [Candidatus Woesebacteria bacterium]|nr:hypothetical protein [Candidatus Woesebacteria bacterium]